MLFQEGKSISEIARLRHLTVQTIESHIVALYLRDSISLAQILDLVPFEDIKAVKQLVTGKEQGLKEIKELLEKA